MHPQMAAQCMCRYCLIHRNTCWLPQCVALPSWSISNVIHLSVMPDSADSFFLSYLFLLCFIPLQLVPVPHYTWFQIEISVIPDSVMPVSLISLCTFWLYLIMLCEVLLYSTSYLSCVVPYFVMPLSVIPKSIYDRFLGPIWPSYLSNFAATQTCNQCPKQPQ